MPVFLADPGKTQADGGRAASFSPWGLRTDKQRVPALAERAHHALRQLSGR